MGPPSALGPPTTVPFVPAVRRPCVCVCGAACVCLCFLKKKPFRFDCAIFCVFVRVCLRVVVCVAGGRHCLDESRCGLGSD